MSSLFVVELGKTDPVAYMKWHVGAEAIDKVSHFHCPDYIATVFSEANPSIDLGALPILDIGDRTGGTGYIDFLEAEDLSAPIMKGVDAHCRSFIAIKVFDSSSNRQEVLTLFQRRASANSSWVSGSRGISCHKCMGDTLISNSNETLTNLRNLLNRTHNYFNLVI